MQSTESDVGYFEVNAVFNGEPVELLPLEESTWTARLRRTGNDSGNEVLYIYHKRHAGGVTEDKLEGLLAVVEATTEGFSTITSLCLFRFTKIL